MKLTADYWIKYINIHTSANKAAEKRMERYIEIHGTDDMDKLSDYAFALVTKYGEAATALSCEMYDKLARAQKADVPDAMPAETATYGEVAKAVKGAAKRSPSLIPDVVGRLVKQAGADTTLQNAKRDNAWFAWVSHGDTCPYCMALAGLGWQKAGELTLKGGHAEHIHANCDCEYVIDLKGDLEIEGYDPDKINLQLLDMTDGEYDAESLIRMSGHNAKGHDHTALNIVRRKQYAANRDYINAQKRAAYARRNGTLSATAGQLPDKMKKYVPEAATRKRIIEDGIAQDKPIFVEPDDLLYKLAKDLPEEAGKYTVVIHGDPYYLLYKGQKIDPDTLCAIIAQRSDYKKGTDIRLISCYTGKADDGVARFISNKLKVNVTAPDKLGIITKNITGKYTVYSGSEIGKRDGKMIPFNYSEKGGSV